MCTIQLEGYQISFPFETLGRCRVHVAALRQIIHLYSLSVLFSANEWYLISAMRQIKRMRYPAAPTTKNEVPSHPSHLLSKLSQKILKGMTSCAIYQSPSHSRHPKRNLKCMEIVMVVCLTLVTLVEKYQTMLTYKLRLSGHQQHASS